MQNSPDIDIVHRSNTSEYNVHYHYDHEIIYISQGKCQMTVNGKSYVVGAGDVVLICNLENHATRVLSEPYERYIITVSPAFLDKVLCDDRLCSMFKQRTDGFCHCLPMADTKLTQIFGSMYDEKQKADEFSTDLISMYFKQIMVTILRRHPSNFPAELSKNHSAVLCAQRFMEAHYDRDVRIDELAKQSFMDKYYFSHVFKEFSGISPKGYLTGVRLSNAIRLLRSTTLSISEISEKCGFSDINNFIRLFKNTFGTTPLGYRKKQSTD